MNTPAAMWPHAVCLRAHYALIWTLVAAHYAIAFAYTLIPTAAVMLYRRRDRAASRRAVLSRQKRLLTLSAAFVLFCGGDHAIEADTFFEPSYYLSAGWTAATAVVSLAAAAELLAVVARSYDSAD